MNNFRLSIVIPTYNGSEWIEDTIESVACQLEPFQDSVEFIVRDNASADRTSEIVSNLNKKYNCIIKYDRRNETAIADVNFREAILLTQGQYVLLLGDDDLLFPNFIRNSLDLIDRYPTVGLFYFNRIATTRNYKGASLKHDNPSSKFVRHYEDVKEFIMDYPSGPDFMSVNMVKRDCLVNGLPFAKSQYYGVEWFSAILYGLKNYKIISIFEPMILQRAPKVRMWDDRALLYVIVGVDNMFKDLDCVYPGIHNVWNNYSLIFCSRFWYLTKCIPLNRKLYKDKYKELSVKLTGIQQFVAYCLLNIPVSYYIFRFAYLANKSFGILFRIKRIG